MKILKKVLIFSVIALIIQQSIFLYIENIYLSSNMNIKIEKSDDEEVAKNEQKEIVIKENLEDLKVSSNGRYVAGLEDGRLTILDSDENKYKDVKNNVNSNIVFYKWVTNSDRIIAIQKIKERGRCYFEPVAFNAKSGEQIELSDFDLNKLRVRIESSEDKVEDIPFSTGTHSLYIKIKKSNGKSDLYYANTMNQLEKKRSNKQIGNIVIPTTCANAIMEMGTQVTILDRPDNLLIPNTKNPKLLGADINDNVYFASGIDNKVMKIYYAVSSNNYKDWKEIKLDNPTNKENVLVDYSGKIYINNKEKNSVTELISKKTINYKGSLIQTYSKGVISKDKDKIIKNEI
ncbi:hypothetical protein [Clostridium taeniosporum]|uniref:Dipeptidyl-peptidase IV n=1 Tax=Clostridium taeniosporum TaxID=394958 RepID=A0A1D7XI62_9CLOT|nr:hypothetical protein [Clostridium taeniosporum]AOR23025.1 hypothetical protein BGI42_04515 [Clostridium taeniosporum]